MSKILSNILKINAVIFLFVLSAWAEESELPIKTTYSLDSDSTETETLLTKDKSKHALIEKYLFSEVKKALEKVPEISNIVFVAGKEEKEKRSWGVYDTKKRESFAYVNLNLNSQVSLLFKITEEKRVCKENLEENVSDDNDWADSTKCDINSLRSTVDIEGPISVYGTYASHIDINKLLKDRQKISVSVDTNYSEEFQMTTKFHILTPSFEEGLAKFFDVFQYKSMLGEHFTRRQLLVGISRAMRTVNEGVLGL